MDKVIKQVSKCFDTFGYPCYIRHDGGPEMRKKFKEWRKQAGVRSELSSAYNSPSNGHCERLVAQMKSIIARCKESKECFWTALAEWRLAPRSDGPSPAQLFFRR